MPVEKKCGRCKQMKLLSEFYLHYSRCKSCSRKEANKYSEIHREKKRPYAAKYRLENPEKVIESNQKWYQAKGRAWYQKRHKTNTQSRLGRLLRMRLRDTLKTQNSKKTNKALFLLGCSIAFLKSHLENQFRDGMSWENHGIVWHIDHIRPCASFDLTNAEQQKCCFHYSNLQPLLAGENLRKGATWAKLYQL